MTDKTTPEQGDTTALLAEANERLANLMELKTNPPVMVIPADPDLLEHQRKATRSESQTELFKALAKAQADFDTIQSTADNDYFKSKYAPLYALWEHARPILKKHGLVLIQEPMPSTIEEGATILNTLAHTSGEWRSSIIVIPVDLGKEGKGKKAPAFGASYTYGRRYGMGGILGLATSAEDSDGGTGDPDFSSTGGTAAEKGWKAWADAECLRFQDCKDTMNLDRYYAAAIKRLEGQDVPSIIPDLLETVWKRRKEELGTAAAKHLGMDDHDPDGDIPQ
jgi:hypothetical protein